MTRSDNLYERTSQEFNRRYGASPALVVRAPGRVNLIGEHTDYNEGFVLPMAIDRAVWIALRPRLDRVVELHSLDLDKSAAFDLAYLERGGEGWAEYPKGVAWALQEAGYPLQGWEGVLASEVPIGAGLSSSAALEVATARAFASLANWEWEATGMAKLAQRAENDWVGVNSGIMDQLAAAAGRAGHALLIDCRSLEITPVPLPSNAAVVILDTRTRRDLLDSAYNQRRAQCQAAAESFGVASLREISMQAYQSGAQKLDPVTRNRARHVVSENQRTLEAAQAMRTNDASRMGKLMNASHASLRDDFEVSSAALNTMAAIAQEQDGCFGARMTGAGFGGCVVALVQGEAAEAFSEHVRQEYLSATGLDPKIYQVIAAQGAQVIQDNS